MTLELRQITRDEIAPWQLALAAGFMMLPDPATIAFGEGVFDDRRIGATFENGRIVGTYVSFPTSVALPGGSCTTANAVSGVTVLPTHRRQGIVRHAITSDLAAAKERGDAVALLLASEFPIYSRFGFGVASEFRSVEVDTRGMKFRSSPDSGSVELMSAVEALPLCKAVFEEVHRSTPSAISRHDLVWTQTFGLMEDREDWTWKGFVAVARSAAGKVDGYVQYKGGNEWLHGRPEVTLQVNDFVTSSPAAHLRLWHYLCTMAWVAKVKVGECAIDDDVRLLPTDERLVHQSARGDHTWARALDVASLLTTRTYQLEDRLTFELTDDLGLVNGRYTLDASPDGATCKRSRTKPDFTLAVNELSSLLFGGASLAAFVRTGRSQEHRAGTADRADRLFRGSRSPWNPTRF